MLAAGGKRCLVGLVTGLAAKKFAKASEEERRKQVLEQYRKYFGTNEAASGVTQFMTRTWVDDPYTGGW